MERAYYFAYSLHMDPANLEGAGIRAVRICRGVLRGYQLAFNVLEDELFFREHRGVANIMPRKDGAVEGVLFALDTGEMMKLDRQAGVASLKFYRKIVPVEREDGILETAYTYSGWPDVTSEGLLPSKRYLKRLTAAAIRQGISSSYRQWLLSHPTD